MGFLSKRGYSSVGRTSDLRSEGHVFDPRLLLRWEFFFLGGVGGVGRKPEGSESGLYLVCRNDSGTSRLKKMVKCCFIL